MDVYKIEKMGEKSHLGVQVEPVHLAASTHLQIHMGQTEDFCR